MPLLTDDNGAIVIKPGAPLERPFSQNKSRYDDIGFTKKSASGGYGLKDAVHDMGTAVNYSLPGGTQRASNTFSVNKIADQIVGRINQLGKSADFAVVYNKIIEANAPLLKMSPDKLSKQVDKVMQQRYPDYWQSYKRQVGNDFHAMQKTLDENRETTLNRNISRQTHVTNNSKGVQKGRPIEREQDEIIVNTPGQGNLPRDLKYVLQGNEPEDSSWYINPYRDTNNNKQEMWKPSQALIDGVKRRY